MEKIDNSERIDRFFREQMSLEERNAILEDLKNDKELREEAQITALLIQELKEERSKQEQEIAQEIRREKSFIASRRVIYWVGSIAALFVLFFGSVRFYQMRQMDNLYGEYYVLAPDYEQASGNSRSANDDEEVKTQLADLFNQVGTTEDVTPTIQKLQSICDSIDSEYEYSRYANDIRWYLALAYLKDHQKDKSIELLRIIVRNNPDFDVEQKKAKDLLKELE